MKVEIMNVNEIHLIPENDAELAILNHCDYYPVTSRQRHVANKITEVNMDAEKGSLSRCGIILTFEDKE